MLRERGAAWKLDEAVLSVTPIVVYRQSQSGVTIVGLGWFSPTDRKTFAVYRVFDTEGATFSRFSQRIRG